MTKTIRPCLFCFIIFVSLTTHAIANPEGDKNEKSQYSIVRSTVGLGGSSNTVATNPGTFVICQSYGQESVTGTFSKKGCFLLQGYQQTTDLDKISIPANYLKAVVFPNPFYQSVTISFDIIVVEKIQIIIYDLKGTVVFLQEFPACQSVMLPLDNLWDGIFFMKVIIGNNKFFSPIIKQQK